MLLLMTFSGCGGCMDSSATTHVADKSQDPKKPPQKSKPDFERMRLVVAPADEQSLAQAVKPGHWFVGSYDGKANNYDFTGSMTVAATNPQGDPMDLEHVPDRLETLRSVVLPKGQKKTLESLFLVPTAPFPPGRTRTWITNQLLTERTGSMIRREMDLVEHLPGYEYDFVVLASEPDRYRYLKVLDSIRPPTETGSEHEFDNHYRMHFPLTKFRSPLPSRPLAWTSIAYVLWDDIDPNWLGPEQQQSMIDWLHWGGQLIISGPLSLDKLKGSFLEPFLPATLAGSMVIEQPLLDTLNEHWSILENSDASRPGTRVVANKPWQGVKLDRHPEAKFVSTTGELMVERNVGRGRIVMSAFRLNQRELLAWHSFDSLVNGMLMRRPARKFNKDQYEVMQVTRVDGKNSHDPTANSQLRYFARDGQDLKDLDIKEKREEDLVREALAAIRGSEYDPDRERNELSSPGVASWNEFGPVSEAARKALRTAAGIEVPPREFVLIMLAGYLAVLVPLNWLFFRIVGRVEWAWIAAPVIAVAAGLVVVRMANLNIGFARSTTEIAVIEAHAGYPRAHVSRYSALYTSLSTSYDMHFDDRSAVAAPFPTDANYELLLGQSRPVIDLVIDEGVKLSGIEVSSNTTGLVHSEQMFDLGGAFEWRHQGVAIPRIVNNSKYAFSGAGVVRCRLAGDQPVTDSYWIGRFEPGAEAAVDFNADRHFLTEGSSLSSGRSPASIDLSTLIALGENPGSLAPGETRLVAWTEDELPGVQITPVASQKRHAAVLVVNLSYGSSQEPQRDANTRRLFASKSVTEMEAEELNPKN